VSWHQGRALIFVMGGFPMAPFQASNDAGHQPARNARDRVSRSPQFLGAPYFSPRSTLRIASSNVSVMSLLVT
jgi:hypothetical protein